MNKNQSRIHILEDEKISWVLVAPCIVLTAQYFFLLINDLLGIINSLTIQTASKVLVAIMFIYVMPVALKRRKVTFICTYLIATAILLSHFVLFPDNEPYIIGILFLFFFMCLPAFVYSLSLNDWDVFRKILRKAGLIVFIFGTASGVLVLIGLANIGDYSMALSYYMLLPAIIYLDKLMDQPAFIPTVGTLVSLFIILALGSRGAIICIITFVVLKIIRPHSTMNFKRVFFYTMTICIGILSIFNLNQIFIFIYNFFIGFGIRSRTLELFLIDINHLSGRDHIYQNIVGEILDSPILGIGIGGDRRVNGEDGLYAHNFFLEVFSNFGLFFGSLILFILILLILNILFAKDKGKYNMAIIWISLGFVHLMVSGSYLTDINFWIFTGLITNYCFGSKNRNN
ncbi:O-antigen ligase family protein [Bacillus sp. DTU_2020_1000418_1_SI_GHA_SEK_038]|uniref:O-antigen ligase family protein n=1 Tax=Bacillus sp. DTU_2020_1000418_1_SI_GHA_SEK_038 TaxID=3077585 RepID=UPI0028F14602|nr:O-antigen ligase family protein [Bacillus sp. DTU_2020_1000418_1_SI_GHA_SEK_038]WNS74828.1 O-antigen ligase family protein [Bacillus sp. DTU_2020_1000418_1_SI_GHA_SEK_038]